MVTQDKPTLRVVSPRSRIRTTNYLGLEFLPSLQAFATQRAELLAALRSLAPEGWSRAATVTGTGPVLERTVLFYAQSLALHEGAHLNQIQYIVTAVCT